MAETYCGKSCADCAQKEAMNCPGCRTGPGRMIGGDCEIARCARDRGHEDCWTCVARMECNTFATRAGMPDRRRRRQEDQARTERIRAERAPVLGKWLWVLFWLIVPGTIGSLLTVDMVAEAFPFLALIGSGIEIAGNLAFALILIRLGSEEEGYRTAGICSLIAYIVNLICGGVESSWTFLFTIPAAVVALYGAYRQYHAHSAVLTGIDNELAGKWEKLWYWELAAMGAMLLGTFLVFIPILGVVAILGGAIATIVLSILQLVYLYRTAKIFREYPQ